MAHMDEQARADAMADALQLFAVARSHFRKRYHSSNVYRATDYGIQAESSIVYGSGWCSAAERAKKAAHAAFRAVPGLRGDK